MSIAQALQDLRGSIRGTAQRMGRGPEGVGLVLVSKTVTPERIREAYQAGERDFGENRVQEWQEKKELLPRDIRWHLIGHLQTNKVKYVVGEVALVHSLDRLELANAIEKQAKVRGIHEVPCLIQVNASGEESKFGLDPAFAEDFVKEMLQRPSIRIKGLMSIGPLTEDEGKVRECFRKTREIRDILRQKFPQFGWDILSMGMSGDYKIAIEEGANLLRIGSLVFGPRSVGQV